MSLAIATSSLAISCSDPVPDARLAQLAEFPRPRLIGSANDGVMLAYDTGPGCLALAPTVTATVDGRPVVITERGRYRRVECGGDCQAEGNGGLVCDAPFIQLSVPIAPPFTFELSDGKTTFRAVVTGDREAPVVAPVGRALTVGDRVTFRTTVAADRILGPELSRADGGTISAMYFDRDTRQASDLGVSFELRAGDCSDAGAALRARVALQEKLVVERCEGGLVACAFDRQTAWQDVSLAVPAASVGCAR